MYKQLKCLQTDEELIVVLKTEWKDICDPS